MNDHDWKAKYRALLLTGNPDDLEVALQLKGAHLPDRIYRFRAFDPGRRSLDGIKSGTAWLSPANGFNDPFDSSLCLNSLPQIFEGMKRDVAAGEMPDLSEEGRKKACNAPTLEEFIAIVSEESDELSAADKQRFPAVMASVIKKQTDESVEALRRAIQRGVKVCSFTTNSGSLAMWAHYTAEHRGFCIEYDVAALEASSPLRRILHPVTYSDERFDLTPHFKPKSAKPIFALVAALHKSSDWAYEDEWRLIQLDPTGAKGLAINMPTPSAIFLGCRSNAGDRQRIKQIAAAKQIPLFEMRLSTTRYAVEPHPRV